MTTEQKIIKTKVGVLELAKQLGNGRRPVRSWAIAEIASIGLSESVDKNTELTANISVFF